MKSKAIVAALAFATIFFAILMPPEAHAAGKMAVLLCSTFAFFGRLAEHRIPSRYLWGGLVLFATVLIHSLAISVDLYRSLDFIAMVWSYYCVLGFFIYADFDPSKLLAASLVLLSLVVTGYGLYQYLWGFDQLYTYIVYSGSDEVVKAPALDRVASRRVFSTLALPGTLWGFLVVALPFHAALWGRRRVLNLVLATSAAMLLTTGFLTRSFGFLLGLFVLAVAWLILRYRRLVWNWLTVVVLILALSGGMFYWARRGAIEDANPASLRLMNWLAGWTIAAANPWGVGLNNYGIVYPQHKLPQANETQYAHSTALQLLAELGYPVVFAGAALLLFAITRWSSIRRLRFSPWIALALLVWSVHNLVDINVYFGSVGTVGAVLIGALLWKEQSSAVPVHRIPVACIAVLGTAAIIFSALAFFSSELQHRAQVEYDSNKPLAALDTLRQAQSFMPLNSSLFFDAGEIFLYVHHRMHKPEYLELAAESYRRAIALSPAKSGPHIGLALCRSSANDINGALEEIQIAKELYPDSSYVQSVARLISQSKDSR